MESQPATKADLTASAKRLGLEIVKMNSRIDRLEASLRKEMARNTSYAMNAIDDFAKKSINAHNAIILHGRAITAIRSELKGCDMRMTALEDRKS
jgi:hypothetical protein